MRRILMECDTERQRAYSEINTILNTYEHSSMEDIYCKMSSSMDRLATYEHKYSTYSDLLVRAMSQTPEQDDASQEENSSQEKGGEQE